MNPALELVSVTAGYGDVPIVREFSARLQAGTITTLIGGNGAGKSTLLRAIYGTNRLFSGQIVFKGETIERLPPWERLKRGVGFVPQGRCNFPAMSVAENLKMGCYTLPKAVHDSAIDRVTGLVPDAAPEMAHRCRQPVGRRAADPGNGHGAAGRAGAPAARRALARPLAQDAGRRLHHRATHRGAAASPCWWSSRTCAARF